MTATVAVVGGGYGGISAAKALDDMEGVADVVLIEPREHFVHNVAVLRGVVDPDWVDRIFFPYDRLLQRGRVIRDRAALVEGTTITLGSGERLAADYVVLGTGSEYPYPAKLDVTDSAAAKAKLLKTHRTLADVDSVLLIGAGPVGLEYAGEIKAAWPNMAVTIVDRNEDIMSGGYSEEFRAELRRQLDGLGVNLVLGTSLRTEPDSAPGEAKAFTVVTDSGVEIAADTWFRCYGVVPNTDYLGEELAAARQSNGRLKVTPELRVVGQDRVFAVGDVTDVQQPKMAKFAGDHAKLVAANIRALVSGRGGLSRYEPDPAGIVVPLGPKGGAVHLPGVGVLGAEKASELKGSDLLVGRFGGMFAAGA